MYVCMRLLVFEGRGRQSKDYYKQCMKVSPAGLMFRNVHKLSLAQSMSIVYAHLEQVSRQTSLFYESRDFIYYVPNTD